MENQVRTGHSNGPGRGQRTRDDLLEREDSARSKPQTRPIFCSGRREWRRHHGIGGWGGVGAI